MCVRESVRAKEREQRRKGRWEAERKEATGESR